MMVWPIGKMQSRAAVARAARADASLVRAKLGHQGFGTVQDRLGVHALRFLEKHVERQYRANVARVVPLLRQERQATEAALKAADEELAALTPEAAEVRRGRRGQIL